MSKATISIGRASSASSRRFQIYPSDVEHDEPLFLREIPVVSGEEVDDARADIDYRANEPVVAFRFNAAAKRRFAQFNIPPTLSRQPFSVRRRIPLSEQPIASLGESLMPGDTQIIDDRDLPVFVD